MCLSCFYGGTQSIYFHIVSWEILDLPGKSLEVFILTSTVSIPATVLASANFKSLNAGRTFDVKSTMASRVETNYGYVVLADFLPDQSVTGDTTAPPYTIETFVVDSLNNRIGGYVLVVSKKATGALLTFTLQNGISHQYTVSSDGSIHPVGQAPMPTADTAEITCKQAVDILCALAGSAAGYYTCIALGLTTGLGGLGCAAALGLIGLFGCGEAATLICG